MSAPVLGMFLVDVVDWFRQPDNWWGNRGLLARLREHAEMSVAAVVAAMVLAIPIAVWLGHRRRFGLAAVNVSNIGRAIPSFAILVVGTQLFGLQDVAVLGSWTVFVALVVLAIPPMMTNAYVAMAEVPDELRDAARGMGLSVRQQIFQVELPVAAPLILGGIRTAAVQVVATATIAAQVGAGGLGRFIIEGFALGPSANDQVFAGAVAVAVFALVVELALAGVQRQLTPVHLRRRPPGRARRRARRSVHEIPNERHPTVHLTTTPNHRQRVRPLAAALLVSTALILASCASSGSSDDATDGTSDTAATTFTFRALDAGGPQTVGALDNGSIDIGVLFTFSPAIAENGWVTLEDDQHLQAADNFVPLIRTDKATDDVAAVVDAVGAKLTHDDLFAMVKEVAVDGQNPDDVAAKWLADNDLPGDLTASGTIKVGSANFAESEIVGYLYQIALADAGADATIQPSIGSRQATMPLMESGELDLMPEFTYSLLAYLDEAATPSNDLDDVVTQLTAAVEPLGLSLLAATDISDVNVYVVTAETAEQYDLSKISDLAKVTDSLTLGGPPECPDNAQCLKGLQSVYGLQFDVK